ncbi:lysozyme inhibitor LprI family protein [Rossellomorea sp. SC111]|uniref:lysozyme inhibitor LprI family protein n=1 Tax=Rossellomorea sp. SC111 TaxID=2968985 RepID=UPI00215B6259|nr:lysozyme inhibitor LprI family protein [Rossellomorea sp. SC111]MCR8848049.1 lysozyme inhibitor LprI family protein [Rossellomorea sp. SC111]
MKKRNWLIVTTLSTALFMGLSACSQDSDEDAAKKPESEATAANTDSDDSQAEDSAASDENEMDQSDETTVEETSPDSPEQDPAVTKVEGKQAYIEKLDNIQKELDAMPEKKDSDKGVTNAMKSYYGVSYEKYDDALNEIYALLKKELSPEVMAELKAEQVKWIEEKEAKAEKERLKYEGGTFENVAWYISLYESTKERCYELVEEYMTE